MANRRPQLWLQDTVEIPVTHAQETATYTEKLWTVPAGRTFRLVRVWYNNPTGLAADAANYFTLSVKQGSTVLASWSTHSTAEGALTADTPVDFTNAADLDAAAGAVLSINLALTGTQTLPAGRLMIEGVLL